MATSVPPSPFRYLALAVVLLCFSVFGCGGATLPAAEVATLRKIAKSLGKIKWNFNVDPCSGLSGWITHATNDNVTCDCTFLNNTVCHVTNIRLKSQSLPGFLPPELADLPFLQEIDLTRNYLNGTIPPEWGSTRLVNITLLGNRLSGSIPKEFGNISTLSSLVLEINQLSGPLPPELGTLSSIKRMFLTSNNFTGHIPSTFANLTTLEDFRLGDNFFSGKIPNFIQYWINLNQLVLQGSGLAGPIPPGISLLANLTDLRITDLNGTEEALFPSLESMKLKTLILRSCNIVGELPYYLGNMTSLKTLDLSFNKLSGMIPESFSSDKIQYIYFTGNSLNGTVPDWMLTSNNNVDISYNNFALGSTKSSCPPQKLNFFGNSLVSNTVGTALCSRNAQCPNKTTFFHINCGGSSYNNGSIIYELDRDTSGPSSYYLSPSNWALSNSGHFLDNTPTSEHYILIANQSAFSTDISQLDMDARVSAISMTYYGFCLENGNYIIDLYFAETAFTSDNTYGSLGRRVFDVYIQGKLELKDFNIAAEAGGNGKEIIKKFVSYVPNGTLEIRLQWAGKGSTAIPNKGVYGPLVSAISATNPSFVTPTTDNGVSSTGAIVGIIISVLVVLLLVVAFLWWKFQHVRMVDDLKGSLDLQSDSFTLRQLRAATNNFDPAYKIGEGGFGPVFKGYLADGTIIAVKQLSSDSNQGNREFVNEIGMISALRHPNLVKLYGCCVEGNQLLLVYEYMANNSLARALFADFKESDLHLDWPTRYKICIGIAKGLSFLHEESALKIVHRDIKATNVLLDTDLTPKISDFGLAKLDEDENTHISTRIAGTFGYMAPEYATRGYLTDKADVYSFGIVALEIVCGRSNTSYKANNNEPFYILDWVLILKEKEQLMDVIDPRLKGDFNKDQVMTVIKIGLLCTDASPTARPAMSSVVSILEGETNADVDSVTAHSSMQTNEITSVEVDPIPYGEDSLVDSQARSDGPWSCASTSIPDLYPVIPDSDYWQKRDCTSTESSICPQES